jgi:hypothetical protein
MMGRTNRDFDGNAGVDAVLVIEIDAIQVESLQASLTGCSHIRWIATDLPLPIRIAKSELGCQFHPLSHSFLQSLRPKKPKFKNKQTNKKIKIIKKKKWKKKKIWDLSEKDFVGEGAVDIGGVEEGDAGVDGMTDESDHVLFGLGRTIDAAGHAHAAEALCRHLQSLRTQLYPPHSYGLHFFLLYNNNSWYLYHWQQKNPRSWFEGIAKISGIVGISDDGVSKILVPVFSAGLKRETREVNGMVKKYIYLKM